MINMYTLKCRIHNFQHHVCDHHIKRKIITKINLKNKEHKQDSPKLDDFKLQGKTLPLLGTLTEPEIQILGCRLEILGY